MLSKTSSDQSSDMDKEFDITYGSISKFIHNDRYPITMSFRQNSPSDAVIIFHNNLTNEKNAL